MNDRKIVTFPTDESNTAETVLARTLEKAKAGHIRAVAIGIVWDDGTIGRDSSMMTVGDRLVAAKLIELDAEEAIMEQWEEEC